MLLLPLTLCLLAADPIAPAALQDALESPLTGEAANTLAERVRASFPRGKDLTQGGHLVDGVSVAFVVAIPEGGKPRVGGDLVRLNHGRDLVMKPIGETGLWARVETIDPE